MRNSVVGMVSFVLGSLAGAAAAQEPFIQGVYLPSQDLCQKAKTSSLQGIMADGNIVLTAKGLMGTDYACRFLQVLKSPDSQSWVATTLCKEPSGSYPDLLSLTEDKPGTLSVVSVYGDADEGDDEADSENDAAPGDDNATAGDDNDDASSAGETAGDNAGEADNQADTGTYYLCEGVAAP
jgi:hypothetical protein